MFEITSYRKAFQLEMPKQYDGAQSLTGKTILFIDDDYVNYLYFKDLLSTTRIRLIRSSSLNQALDILKKSQINVVIMSYSITGNNNSDALTDLKKRFPYLPLILFIKKEISTREMHSLKLKCDICINEYIDSSHLTELIRETLFNATQHNDLKYYGK